MDRTDPVPAGSCAMKRTASFAIALLAGTGLPTLASDDAAAWFTFQ